MNPSILPWWAWLLLAAFLWLWQLVVDDEKWSIRIPLIVGMVLTFAVGVIRFVKWVWNA